MFENLKVSRKNLSAIRLSIGLVYFLFGVLKFIPNLSPAEALAETTINTISGGLINGRTALVLLAILEVGIGLMLFFKIYLKSAIKIALAHMFCTFLPFIIDPASTFNLSAHSLSIVGQYILKNLIIISVLAALYQNEKVELNKVNI